LLAAHGSVLFVASNRRTVPSWIKSVERYLIGDRFAHNRGAPGYGRLVQSRRLLVGVSAIQLGFGVAGQLLALRRRLHYDIAVVHWRGTPENVGRDSLFLGTALSAPGPMLAAQTVATIRLARAESPLARRTLGMLGAAMTPGYLVERSGRAALKPSGWDRAVTPVVIGGTGLAAAMAAIGLGRFNLTVGRR
jgi:hypothetical protein